MGNEEPDQTQDPDGPEPFISEVADAWLYLSGYIVLPLVFLFVGGVAGAQDSPAVFAAVVVAGFYGVLAVKYLPPVARRDNRTERATFAAALRTVGADSDRWAFLWYVAMAAIVTGFGLYWLR